MKARTIAMLVVAGAWAPCSGCVFVDTVSAAFFESTYPAQTARIVSTPDDIRSSSQVRIRVEIEAEPDLVQDHVVEIRKAEAVQQARVQTRKIPWGSRPGFYEDDDTNPLVFDYFVETWDGTDWRQVGRLRATSESPSAASIAVGCVLAPGAIALDIVLFPLECLYLWLADERWPMT